LLLTVEHYYYYYPTMCTVGKIEIILVHETDTLDDDLPGDD